MIVTRHGACVTFYTSPEVVKADEEDSAKYQFEESERRAGEELAERRKRKVEQRKLRLASAKLRKTLKRAA